MSDWTFWLCVMVASFALLIIGGVIWFGLRIFTVMFPHIDFPMRWVERLLHDQRSVRSEAAQLIADTLANYRERRNEFWTAYVQIVLAVFIVAVLVILLLTKTIDADAGLPILSGISGFAIAKSVSTASNRGVTGVPTEERET